MNNTIETKEHIKQWILKLGDTIYLETCDIAVDNIDSGEELDLIINNIEEDITKLRAYLEKLRSNKYE